MIVLIKITCIVLAIAIIALVLLQQGKGSDLGSAFGGGSSNSMFGALGPSDFLGNLMVLKHQTLNWMTLHQMQSLNLNLFPVEVKLKQ
tara:strand:+ start:465 stop:728 length:264 start_codon:yes stop_codon:yes gene_type:complete